MAGIGAKEPLVQYGGSKQGAENANSPEHQFDLGKDPTLCRDHNVQVNLMSTKSIVFVTVCL